MDDLIYPKINLKILSQRFRDIRTDNDFSLRGISRSENITHTVVSDIENGKVYPNVDTLKSLYARVNIDLLTDETLLSEYKEMFETIKDSVYYAENNMVSNYMKDIDSKADELTNSLVYVDFLLVCALYEVVIENKNESDNLDILESYYTYLCDRQKIEMNLLKGIVNQRTYAFKKAALYYERNVELKGYKKALAMTYTHLAQLYKQTYHTYNTIEYGKIASRLHAEEANLFEKLRTDCLVANELIDIGRFTEARRYIDNIFVTVDQKNGQLEVIHRYLHFLWSYWYYKQGDYKEAHKRLVIDTSDEPSYYYYQANILEKDNQIDKAINVLNEASSQPTTLNNELYQHLIPLYQYDLSEAYDHPKFENTLQQCLDKEYLIEDFVIYKHIHEIALKYYDFHNDRDKALALMHAFFERGTYK
jgi:transcriptional regulator with XRE-family HTH domain